MNTKSSFYPACDLESKSNFKKYFIKNDGEIFERILLNVLIPEEREAIICTHYLRNFVKLFSKSEIGVNIISRDKPWDFEIVLNSGESFNMEITSIADNPDWFKKFKYEERFDEKALLDKLPFHEILKLNKLSPSSKAITLIEKLKQAKTSKDSMVNNPYKGDKLMLISEGTTSDFPLEKLIQNAIEKKELKKHSEKENTVLIIDNRTIEYDFPDYRAAMEYLEDFIEKSSFKEIWFYTGYCSDLDGNNADYMLAPMKITTEQEIIISKMTSENGVIKI